MCQPRRTRCQLILRSRYRKFLGRLWVKCREIIGRCEEVSVNLLRGVPRNMQGSSELVERIIQGAQKYFRGSSEENWGSVRVGCRVLIRCFYFSPPFLMFLSVFFQRSKKAIRHTLRSIFFWEWTVLYWKVFVGIWPGGTR